MSKSKKIEFQAYDKAVTIEVFQKRKGLYWAYQTVPQSYGPFRDEKAALNDAKLYSQYGTTNKALIVWTTTGDTLTTEWSYVQKRSLN